MSQLDEAFHASFEHSRRASSQAVNRASQSGTRCARRLQWNRTRWREAKMFEADVLKRFALGTLLEDFIVDRLKMGGVKVEGQQRDVEWKKYQITGRIDGTIRRDDGKRLVFECKTASRFSFATIQKAGCAEELLQNRAEYVRGYVVQAALYALMLEVDGALLFFVEKESLKTHTIEVMLDDDAVLNAANDALDRYTKVNAAIEQGVDLPPEPNLYCDDCPFLTVCNPDRSYAGDLKTIQNEEVENLIATKLDNADAVSAFNKADEELKKRFNEAGTFLVGPYEVSVKSGETTKYEIPDGVKKEFAVKVPQLTRKYRAL